MTTVEALTHGKHTGRLVYGKHTAMAAASRNMVQKLHEQSTNLDKTRVRNCTHAYSTHLRVRQDFNLLTRTQTMFWLNKKKTHRLDRELTFEFKKRQSSVREVGNAGVRALALTLGTRNLRDGVNNCVRTQSIMNYETRHYVSFDTQNRRTQSANVRT